MKRKVGRPRKIVKLKISNEQLTLSALALNQVDFSNKYAMLSSIINNFAKNQTDIVEGVNKQNFELSNKIQALETRCADLEKRVSASSVNPEDVERAKKEFN